MLFSLRKILLPALLAGILAMPGRAGDGPVVQRLVPQGDGGAAAAGKAGSTLVLWTPLAVTDPLARAVEALVQQHNLRNAERDACLRCLPAAEFDPAVSALESAVPPPDLFLLPASRIRALAARGLLQPLDEWVRGAGIPRAEVLEPAWKAVEAEGGLWGLPFAADARFRLVNRDRLTSDSLDLRQLPSLPFSTTDWAGFEAGRVVQFEGDSRRLAALVRGAGPGFRWVAMTGVGEKQVARDSFEVWGVAAARGTRQRPEAFYPILRAFQSPAMSGLVWSRGERLPVSSDPKRLENLKSALHVVGPWIDRF